MFSFIFSYLETVMKALTIVSMPLQFLILTGAVFLFFCQIVGVIVVIKWFVDHARGGYRKDNKAGLNKDEYNWMRGKK